MKKTIAALLASAALLAVPAVASAHEGDRNDWRRDSGYVSFRQEFNRINRGIQHGLRDGSFSRREAQQFNWGLNSIRRRLDGYWYNDGFLSRGERRDIQWRIRRLQDVMQRAHQEGHAEQDWGYRYDDYHDDDHRDGRYRDDGYDRYSEPDRR